MRMRKPPPDDLDARLKKAREELDRQGWRGPRGPRNTSFGMALEVAIEMVGTLAVSVGIGWVLDDWLATRPLFLVIFFFLGAAAGGLNVYRRAQRITGEGGGGDGNGGGKDAGARR